MDCTGAVTAAIAAFVDRHLEGRSEVCVGLSGGPDSLALTAGAVRAGLSVRALIVDHGLQHNSHHVADAAAAEAQRLGADSTVLGVTVGHDGGMEAAARTARYAALDAARDGRPVLLAHTMDDQAETVLLGLARGSGARSLAGMRPWREPWGRPLLGLRRSDTVGACTELGLAPHADPHNRDPRFTRVRLRSEVLPLLDEVVHGGVVAALARTADALAADGDALDAIAVQHYSAAKRDETDLDIASLVETPPAIRTRVLRLWLLDVGATEPTSRVIGAVDELLRTADNGGAAKGQVASGGDADHRLVAVVASDRLTVGTTPRA